MQKKFQEFLLKSIPIAKAMGISVEHISSTAVSLRAPIANNVNHKNTVFGGSLHSVATLACWSWFHLKLEQAMSQAVPIVIVNSEISYLKPVTSDFVAECKMPDSRDWETFLRTFQKKGKGRLKLNASIFQGNQLCVEYSGTFAAIKNGFLIHI